MSHARNFDCLIVIAAIILAAAGTATVFSFLHRPAVAESAAAPTLVAPEVSRPMTAETSDAQPPTEPQEVKSSYVPRDSRHWSATVSRSCCLGNCRGWAGRSAISSPLPTTIGLRSTNFARSSPPPAAAAT
jgi:hypothetical protein